MIEQQVNELLEIAAVLYREGNYSAALTKLDEVDRLDPGMPQSLTQRAHILIAMGQAGEAVKIFKVIHQHFPDEADVLGELANATFLAGDQQKGFELAEQALALDPESSFCLETMGRIANDLKRWKQALEAFEKLAEKHPDNPMAYKLWANALFQVMEYYKGAGVYKKILDKKLEPLDYDHAFTIGLFYFSGRKFDEAAKWYEKALKFKPDEAAVLVGLARCAIQAGDLDKGEALIRRALKATPDSVYAFTILNDLKPEETNQKTADLLEAKLKADDFEDDTEKMRTCLFVGKFYHKEKQIDKAFDFFRRHNELKFEIYRQNGDVYDRDVMEQNFAETKRIFSKSGLKKVAGHGSDSEVPVFIIAMPRSGTTLLEQIIASHSKVYGAGEVRAMTRNFMDLNFAINEEPDKDIYDIIRDEAKGWADYYLNDLNAPKGVTRVTDKMPVNFIYLGQIQAMFPNARVIHIKRNPLDTCLSMYSNDFSESYSYSTRFSDLGHYYNHYASMMDHWKKTLSMKFMELQYEDLVANQEAKSREVLEFCGLEWEPQVLEYYKGRKAAYTISQVQVSRPINTKGVARWKPYKKYIGELIEALDEDIVGPLKD